ncbi:MAG: gamma-glutamylcyclotransferase [Nitrospirota bacterium]|nr:gamma-glutamylcyclotransferase [Nitrospirota bacterium]
MAWIFTYDQLMWDFPFNFQSRQKALLEEHHRSFNYFMVDHFGSPEAPSPGLGLETAGDCTGIAYLIPEDEEEQVLESLTQRYRDNYLLRESAIIVNGTSSEDAYFFISDRNNPNYIGKIVPQEVVKIAKNGSGPMGTGIDWVLLLSEKMTELGIMDLAVDAATSLLKWHGFGNQQTHRTHF